MFPQIKPPKINLSLFGRFTASLKKGGEDWRDAIVSLNVSLK